MDFSSALSGNIHPDQNTLVKTDAFNGINN